MFAAVTTSIRESVYGVSGLSQIGKNQVNSTTATGFMIAPGVLATAAHFVHVGNKPTKPGHKIFEAIRAPDIGQKMESATLIAEDPVRDVALLRIQHHRSAACVRLVTAIVPRGTSCGSLGFPLGAMTFTNAGRSFNLTERFQGASISAYQTVPHPSGRQLGLYETDALMYSGASGCPGYLVDGRIWGMHVGSIVDPTSEGKNAGTQADRLAISVWVPAIDIAAFAAAQGVALPEGA